VNISRGVAHEAKVFLVLRNMKNEELKHNAAHFGKHRRAELEEVEKESESKRQKLQKEIDKLRKLENVGSELWGELQKGQAQIRTYKELLDSAEANFRKNIAELNDLMAATETAICTHCWNFVDSYDGGMSFSHNSKSCEWRNCWELELD